MSKKQVTARRKKMKKMLTKANRETWYFVDGVRVDGVPSGIIGGLTGIRGDLSGVTGNLTGIRGNLTGITGNLTGIRGCLDDCKITDKERKKGIDILKLIK